MIVTQGRRGLAKKFMLLVAIGLAGCAASTSKIGERSPVQIYHSDKPASELAACIANRLSWLTPPSVIPQADGRTRVMLSYAGRSMVDYEIIDGPTRSIEVRAAGGYSGKIRNDTEGCL